MPSDPKAKPRQFIFAVDFDGTICENKFPQIGAPNLELIENLRVLRRNGNRVILWTCRAGEFLAAAIAWCATHDLTFDAVNEDIPEVKESEFGKSKSAKVFAHVYIDDRNMNPLDVCEQMSALIRESLAI